MAKIIKHTKTKTDLQLTAPTATRRRESVREELALRPPTQKQHKSNKNNNKTKEKRK